MKTGVNRDIGLWIATVKEFETLIKHDPQTVFTTVSEVEQKRYSGIVNRAAGLHFLLGRYLLRYVLSTKSGVSILPADWEIFPDEQGRPRVLNQSVAPIKFSISHASGVVAIALSSTVDPGIDLEPLARELGSSLNFRHLLSPEQYDQVMTIPSAAHCELLTRVWCIKESVSKVCGLGLRLPFSTIEFDLVSLLNSQLATWLECKVRERGSFWFNLCTLAQRYWLCVAMESPALSPLGRLEPNHFNLLSRKAF